MGTMPCPNEGCGGSVEPTKMDGRYYYHRNTLINVPADFTILRCVECGQEVFSEASMVALSAILEEEYKLHAPMVNAAIERFERRSRR